jgi:hypothetical protein
VSSKYLDLTKKKLELTRLPHEILLPPAREWENGTPKGEIEPLIDYWYVGLFLRPLFCVFVSDFPSRPPSRLSNPRILKSPLFFVHSETEKD